MGNQVRGAGFLPCLPTAGSLGDLPKLSPECGQGPSPKSAPSEAFVPKGTQGGALADT